MDQVNRPVPNEPGATPDPPPGLTGGGAPLFRPAPFPGASAETPAGEAAATPPPAVQEPLVPLPPQPQQPPVADAPVAASPPLPPLSPGGDGDVSDGRDGAWSAGRTVRDAFGALGRNWAVAIPIALFAIAALIVPTMTQIATTDDWGYTRSVEELYWNIDLVVYPVVAATAIEQVVWGGLFALVFGMDLGVMRLSTVVAVAIGAMALYAILRMLGVSR
ncbi:MAG: hypothetical protein ACTHQE_04555, partial [Thermomicrobiales bacterium]